MYLNNMVHELIEIVNTSIKWQQKGIKSVLASVVYLEGSSYRKPGVRMLISEQGEMIGAVSGGCVEKEIKLRSASVFEEGVPKVISYDGRYRLGCEGVLYILIEPFFITENFLSDFNKALQHREKLTIHSVYEIEDDLKGNFGSTVVFQNSKTYPFSTNFSSETNSQKVFTQVLEPRTKLVLIGGEHDAVSLCKSASLLGWEIEVITSVKDPKTIHDFPGASSVLVQAPELLDVKIDEETVVVLMTHNYVLDLKFLLKIIEAQPKYIGVLGSSKRRNQLQQDLFHYKEDITDDVLSSIYSPAGLNIGAITPEEIAVSILSEILTVLREKEPFSLRDSSSRIHSK